MISKQALTTRQQTNLKQANRWFNRAQKDFNAFKLLVPFGKNTRKPVRCSDPALAVYLLQQSVEKASKAIAAATGKYPYRRLKQHGHNSLVILLDFLISILDAMAGRAPIRAVFEMFGLDARNGLSKIANLKSKASKEPRDREKGELLYREQYIAASSSQIDGILDFLLLIRDKAFLGALKSVFGPHSKVVLDQHQFSTATKEDFVSSVLTEAGRTLNLPQLSEYQLKSLASFVETFEPDGLSHEDMTGKTIIRRDANEQLGQWSVIALVCLAALSFPHESTSRYPGPDRKQTLQPAGCEDYDTELGIVGRLGRMGYVTSLAIDELKPQLKAIAAFFPVLDTVNKG